MLPQNKLKYSLFSIAIFAIFGSWLLTACSQPAASEPPEVSDPKISAPTPQEPGQEVGISVDVSSASGASLTYAWRVDGGEIVRGDGSPAITYRTPEEPGIYNVRVAVMWDDSSVEKITTIRVEAPAVVSADEPPTDTPTPEPTDAPPTATAPPPTSTLEPTATLVPATATPAPTNTPRPTPIPTATIDADPTVYDNFNNPAFDGSINSGLWEKSMPWGAGCSMQQQDGKVIFSSTGSSNSPLCILDAGSAFVTEIGSLEAMIYAEPGGTGNYNVVSVEFFSELNPDRSWFAQCGIFQNPNDGWLAAGLNVDTTNSGEDENYMYEYKGISYGQWYKFRVELHPTTAEVNCYLNDTLIASHLPEEADILKNLEINRELGAFWSNNTQVTYYIDDVRIISNTP